VTDNKRREKNGQAFEIARMSHVGQESIMFCSILFSVVDALWIDRVDLASMTIRISRI
jgi:hypothetical protein